MVLVPKQTDSRTVNIFVFPAVFPESFRPHRSPSHNHLNSKPKDKRINESMSKEVRLRKANDQLTIGNGSGVIAISYISHNRNRSHTP